jgi:hypothetical protein
VGPGRRDGRAWSPGIGDGRRRPTTDEQTWLPPLESGQVAACSTELGQNAGQEFTGRWRARQLPPSRPVAEATQSALLIVLSGSDRNACRPAAMDRRASALALAADHEPRLHKPLNVLVHQLVGGITRRDPRAPGRAIGMGPGNRLRIAVSPPTTIRAGIFPRICGTASVQRGSASGRAAVRPTSVVAVETPARA